MPVRHLLSSLLVCTFLGSSLYCVPHMHALHVAHTLQTTIVRCKAVCIMLLSLVTSQVSFDLPASWSWCTVLLSICPAEC